MSRKGKKSRSTGGAQTKMQQRLQESRLRQGQRPVTDSPTKGPSLRPPTPQPATKLTHYLDVSAVRIQEWILRTPDLRLRRGASILLTERTRRDEWTSRLPDEVLWNEEAGDLDGVVSLRVEDAVDGAAVPAVLATAAREVAGVLRRSLPFVALQAVSGAGPTYAHAFQEMERRRRRGELLVDAPGARAPHRRVGRRPPVGGRRRTGSHPQARADRRRE